MVANGGLKVEDVPMLPTSRMTDDSGTTAIVVSPLAVDVVSFCAFGGGIKSTADFLPHATLRIDGLPEPLLVSGLDMIMSLLDALFPDEPLSPHRAAIADMMEYGQEPWVYHLRDLFKEGSAKMLMMWAVRFDDFTPSEELFRGLKLEAVACYGPTQ